jgi:hypothetical protein
METAQQPVAVAQPTVTPLSARAAFFATHVTAAAYLTLIAKLRLSECI